MATFYIPTKLIEEKEAVRAHAADIAKYGTRALIVTGRNSAVRCGAYNDVTAALDSCGVGHVWFNEVEENPSIETIMRARDFGLEAGVDFVIGIGGGSPLDAAKAIAVMIEKADKDVNYLYNPDGDSAHLPVVAVPTTCGTGSEVTAVSVLTNTPKGVKKSIPHKIFPELALVDGKYLENAPFSVIANTGFDALAHLIESFMCTKATPYTRMCTDAGLREWAKNLPVLRGEKEADEEDHMSLMRASSMAGLAIAHTATNIPHGLSYALTYHLGVPHGKACAYFMTGYLKEAPADEREYVLTTAGFRSLEDFREVFHKACGGVDADAEKLQEVLNTAVEETGANPVKLGLASFSIDKDMLRRIAYYELEH